MLSTTFLIVLKEIRFFSPNGGTNLAWSSVEAFLTLERNFWASRSDAASARTELTTGSAVARPGLLPTRLSSHIIQWRAEILPNHWKPPIMWFHSGFFLWTEKVNRLSPNGSSYLNVSNICHGFNFTALFTALSAAFGNFALDINSAINS